MTTILASPARRQSSPRTGESPAFRMAQVPSVEADVLDWLIGACADHLAAAPQPTRAALAAHLLASSGYRVADGFDEQAHNLRVDLAQGIAARLLHGDRAEPHGRHADAVDRHPRRTGEVRSAR